MEITDESPLNFDMLGNKTVDFKGVKTGQVKSTGHEKTRFAVLSSSMADCTEFKHMVIFKCNNNPKINFLPGAFLIIFTRKGG